MVGFATEIAHPVGFLTGAAVYALLLAMVLRETGVPYSSGRLTEGPWYQRLRLPLCIGILGVLWNLASLAVELLADIWGRADVPLLALLATSALGSLPAVAMHSVWQTASAGTRRSVGVLTAAGYGLSLAAVALNALAVLSGHPVPSPEAWRLLTWGFLVIFALLLGVTKRSLDGHSGLVLVFLAVCAIVALPLSHHPDDSLPWWFDFLGHHASLPLAVAVLYRDYRFAFVDHFLKRTFSFLLLAGMSFGLYVTVVLPLLPAGGREPIAPALSGLVITLWVMTALVYPWLHRQVTWVFDALVLHRPDYQELRRELAQQVSERESADLVLSEVCQRLAQALRSPSVRWKRIAAVPPLPCLSDGAGGSETAAHSGRVELTGPVQMPDGGLSIMVPTLDAPRCLLSIAPPVSGHRFLSEDGLLVEAAALIAARRIDTLRTSHERCEVALREQEMQKLSTEAELRALRAQINPHFLFNALNTIGYLIDTAPERAATTLNDLTGLLRGMLRRMDGSFTTLGEELELIRSYLDIERARFEERLTVRIDVPEALRGLQVPALVLQPIVENAVKHGIQSSLDGGTITIVAREMPASRRPGHSIGVQTLSLEVCDTGAGATAEQVLHGRQEGIGLTNVERRLRGHYGAAGALTIVSEPGVGTTVELRLPAQEPASPTAVQVASATGQRAR